MPHVLEQRPEARLLIVGTGPYETELREQAAHLGVLDRVEVTSVPNDDRGAMAALLRRVSLMVLLSEFETHPMSVLEAATAGCRIVVADRGGLTELAEEGLARAVPLKAAPAVVGQAILEELDQPTDRQRLTLPSWDACSSAHLELYGSLT
jgi:glycosyltransferase involved in cell wall biosynthesis